MKARRRSPKKKWSVVKIRPRGSRLYRDQAKSVVDGMVRSYTERGVPRHAALRAGLRELRDRGAHLDEFGAHCVRYMERLLKGGV